MPRRHSAIITARRSGAQRLAASSGFLGRTFTPRWATVDADGRRNWISTASVGGRAPNLPGLASKLIIAPEFLSQARALITPGTTLILTDAPVSDRTHSAPGFNILTTETK